MNHNEEFPDFELGDVLLADALKKLNELLGRMQQAEADNQGSNCQFVYVAKGAQYVNNQYISGNQVPEPVMPQTEVEDVSDDERVLQCIKFMNEEGTLKHLYDYTWLMEVMNQTKGLPSFDTPNSFVGYLRNHGIKRLPSEDSINKKQNVFTGIFPDWVFTDCDTTEAKRRINVGKRFLSLFRKP